MAAAIQPIGTYRQAVAPGIYQRCPFYCIRRQFLPLVRRTMLQVQVLYLGTLMWINVNEADVEPPSVILDCQPTVYRRDGHGLAPI